MDRLTLTLLGHKDHGKSTLIGRLLHDTKSVRADRVAEVRAASRAADRPFDYSFLVDSFQEERRNGMTMDVIHAQVTTGRRQYDCVDVPGHKELIQNMLTGASRADAGLFIVSALEGVEEQTGQHLRLARWLGLDRLIVAVNKMDAAGYSELKFSGLVERVAELLGRPVSVAIPISALTGEQVAEPSTNLPWYKGPTLVEALDALEREPAPANRPLRIPIQDAYPAPGGRWLVGRVESGTVRIGHEIALTSRGVLARVTELLVSNLPARQAGPGENVGLRLEPDDPSVGRGTVAYDADAPVTMRADIAADAIFLSPSPEHAIAECGAAKAECDIDGAGGAEVGEVVPVRLRCRAPLPVEAGRTALGRIALKTGGRVIGVATVRREGL